MILYLYSAFFSSNVIPFYIHVQLSLCACGWSPGITSMLLRVH